MITTSNTFPRTLAALLALAALACDKPGVAPTEDTLVCPSDGGECVLPPTPGTIQGSAVYQGTKRGDVMLLLFAANNLPPPDGTATNAVSLARIPSSTFFGNQSGAGPFSGTFTFTQVPPGSYQIRALIDVNDEFDPLFDYLQQPRAGYPVGGHVEFDANGVPKLANFDVPSNGTAKNINVALGQETLFDPPSFVYATGTPVALPVNIDRPQFLTLETQNLGVPKASFTQARFAIELDRDANGQPQISDGDGLVDVYPKVLLRQLDALQANGQSIPVTGEDQAIVPCKVDPLPWLPQLMASVPGQAPIGATRVSVLVQPLAVKLHAGVPSLQPSIPPGNYQLVVINKSGQAWTIPNSLGTQQGLASQAIQFNFGVVIAPAGAISGKVVYPPGRKPGNLIVQAYKGGPANAPPLAATLPSRVRLIPKRFLNFNATTRTVDFTLDALVPGSYAVEALDDGDGNFNSFNILQTPTKGDLTGGVIDSLGHLVTLTVGNTTVTAQATLISAPGQDGAGNGTPLDPPAFYLDESAGPAQISQDAKGTVRIAAVAKPVDFPAGQGSDATTFFTVGLVRDAAGATVDSDGDGLADVWPRAFLVKLDDNDPTGLTQAKPTVIIPAAVDPTPFLPALLAPGAPAVLASKTVSIIVRPAALDVTDPSVPVRQSSMPAGKYKVVLMNATGQLWQIPNEAGPDALAPASVCPSPTTCGPGQVSTATQSRSFKVVLPAAPVPAGSITGTLKILGGAATTVKAVYVYAFSAGNPPPPLGTGRPVSADVHFGSELVVADPDKTLAFNLRGLAAGDYYVEAIVDTRGDYALDPFLYAAAPGPGSLTGAHVDASFKLALVTVDIAPVPGQDVLVAANTPLPARPAFVLADASGVPATGDLSGFNTSSASPMKFKLQSKTVLDATTATTPEAANSAAFVVQLKCNGTATVDSDFDNLPDVYPSIRLVKLDPTDPTGMRYDTSSGGLIAIPAAVDPTPYLGSGGISCSGAKTKTVTEVTVLVSPAAVKQVPGQPLQQLADIPQGRYGVVAIEGSGQVWRLPNELQPALLDPQTAAIAPDTFASLAAQGLAFGVAAGSTPAGGAIQGQILLSNLSPAAVGNLVIAAYRAIDPPPPSGTGRPVLATIIPRPYVAQAIAAGRIPYALEGLPADTYLVVVLHDQADRFNPVLSFMATPGTLSQLAFAGGASPAPIVVAAAPVSAPDVILDGVATQALPFERPMFAIDGTTSPVLPAGAAAPIVFKLSSTTPSALPGGLVIEGGTPIAPAFHPHLVFVGGVPQKGPDGRFAVTSQVLITPTTPGPLGVLALVDPRPFCGQLVTGADAECTTGTPIVASGVPAIASVQSLTLTVINNQSADLVHKTAVAGRPPTGTYRISVIEFTGQSWSIPNELAASGGTDGAGQAGVFVVQ